MRKIYLLMIVSGIMVLSSCNKVSVDESQANINNADPGYLTSAGNETAYASNYKTIPLTKDGFIEKVMDYENNPEEWKFKGDIPCIIDFYADWCGPCKKAASVLEELAKEYGGKINIYKVNTEKERELTAAFGIRGIPSFLFCPKNGNPTMSSGIGRSRDETKEIFVKMIDEILL